ncbi:unnamed protein product [Mucor hiemalis]
MAIAFSVLSLKRNRSTSKAHSFTNVEPVSKLSKLKSGFSLFSRITQSLSQEDKRSGLFQYFRNNSNSDNDRKAYDNDRHFEHNQYYSAKKSDHEKRNIHTLPTATTQKLTGILIKRSGTNPTTIAFKHYEPENSHQFSTGRGRRRTYSNATISNMTINSEDLTAKEFADIAGIRILPEEENTIEDDIEVIEGCRRDVDNEQRKFSQDEDIVMNNATISSRYTNDRLSVLSCTSFQSYSTQSNKLKIWDNEFWFHPEVPVATASRITASKTTVLSMSDSGLNRKLSTRSTRLAEPPILHELRRMNTTGNDSNFIKKGRFEIHLGNAVDGGDSITSNTDENTNNTDSSTLSFSDTGVLEWKRKGKKNIL